MPTNEAIQTGSFSHTLAQIDAAVDAVPGKQDALTFDNRPTDGHTTQVVSSGGIFDEIYKTTTELASGTSLATLAPGKYRAANATIAASIPDTPYTASGFYVVVEKVSDITIQTLYSVTTAGSRYFKRVIGSINTGDWFSYPNEQRVPETVYGTGTEIESGTNLNSLTTPGIYYSPSATVSGSLTNCPFTNYGFRLEVRMVGTARYTQFLFPMTRQSTHYGEGMFFMRQYGTDSAWASWYKFSGTAV